MIIIKDYNNKQYKITLPAGDHTCNGDRLQAIYHNTPIQ